MSQGLAERPNGGVLLYVEAWASRAVTPRWAKEAAQKKGWDWMIEIVGIVAAVLAVVGVVFNNYKLIVCFYLWMVSNAACFVVHGAAGLQGAGGMWPMAARDIVFFCLAIHGLWVWGKRPDKDKIIAAQDKQLLIAGNVIENLGDIVNVKDRQIVQLQAKLKQEIKNENNEKT